jgi:hypothetical protein
MVGNLAMILNPGGIHTDSTVCFQRQAGRAIVGNEKLAGSTDENPLFATPEGVPLGQGTKSQRKRIEKAMLSHVLVPS